MRYLSLFSGIEAAAVAWAPLGWQCAAVAEIEPFPCALLAHHFPGVPNLGDITRISRGQIDALGPIDLVVGGFPCQDLSVAGKRAGMGEGSATRSALFWDALRIADWSGARYVVIENVPGLFSSSDGRDFAAVAGALAGCQFDVPPDGWANAGAAAGPNGLVEWRTLDAQFVRVESHPRAVPQRRRRVFIVRHSGDWARSAPVLLERESLHGHPAPRREAGERIAGPIVSGAHPGGFNGQDIAGNFYAYGGNNTAGPIDVATACNGHGGPHGRLDFESETFIAHSLRADGFDASEDGTGRGTPLVPISFRENASFAEHGVNIAGTLNAENLHAIAFSCKDSGDDAGDISPTLRSMNGLDGNANGGGQVAIAFDARQSDVLQYGAKSGPLDTCRFTMGVAFQQNQLGEIRMGAVNGSLNTNSNASGRNAPLAMAGMQVRRLTPLECERLQGFPDGWTDIPYKGKRAADGPRYKALGNSFAVNCIRYIGERIAQHERAV
jgi:DNA (cytosine-5)-methyltransferase 1